MRALLTTFEGGGHVPPALTLGRRLKARGWEVLVLSDEANRAQVRSAGLAFRSWRRAPNRRRLGDAGDPLQDFRARAPWRVVRAVLDGAIAGPARAYAEDALEAIDAFDPDVLVSNELLFGAMMAAERRGIPLALITAGVWCFPTREAVPPFGPGFAPARTGFERRREAGARELIAGWYDQGLPALNGARLRLGLPPLARALDQLGAADLVLLGTASAFDYGQASDGRFLYAGPLAETPRWAEGAGGVELLEPGRPNVLVSFSTAFQDQEAILGRCVRALRDLPVRAVVTLGPALSGARLPHAPNVAVVERADHDRLVPGCALVLCHGGHGTLIRPLSLGVPVVVIPTGRDQPENAARLAFAGAGLRLPRRASAGRIRRAVERVLLDHRFRARAGALAGRIAAETDGGLRAAQALEALLARLAAPPALRPATAAARLTG